MHTNGPPVDRLDNDAAVIAPTVENGAGGGYDTTEPCMLGESEVWNAMSDADPEEHSFEETGGPAHGFSMLQAFAP